MILAGGTGLALQLGHRISEDLDFFTNARFQTEWIISAVRDLKFSFKLITEEEGSLTLNIHGIKTSFFQYKYPFVDRTVLIEGVPVASILDIASMKIIAISQRGTKRDFVDLYFILQKVPFHKIAKHIVKRFGTERINPVHIGKSLIYFADPDSESEPIYTKNNETDWAVIKRFFQTHIKQFVFDLDAAEKEA